MLECTWTLTGCGLILYERIWWTWLSTIGTWVSSGPLFQWRLTTYCLHQEEHSQQAKWSDCSPLCGISEAEVLFPVWGSPVQEKDWQTGGNLNRGLLRWWRGRRNTWNKERLRKLGFFDMEKRRQGNLLAAFSYLLPVIERRVFSEVQSERLRDKSCHNGNSKCIYKFTVRTVKHWYRFSREAG